MNDKIIYVSAETHKFLKVESAKKGFTSIDSYLRDRLDIKRGGS